MYIGWQLVFIMHSSLNSLDRLSSFNSWNICIKADNWSLLCMAAWTAWTGWAAWTARIYVYRLTTGLYYAWQLEQLRQAEQLEQLEYMYKGWQLVYVYYVSQLEQLGQVEKLDQLEYMYICWRLVYIMAAWTASTGWDEQLEQLEYM